MAVSVKHVGTHNNKKIVVLFRQTPNEDHMALVVYSDSMPSLIHDAVMECVSSDVGQQLKILLMLFKEKVCLMDVLL